MGLFRKNCNVTDINGVKYQNDTPFIEKGKDKVSETERRRGNRYYYKYFRGYSEVRKLNQRGRVTVERHYTQPWIVSGLSTVRYWLLRLLYAVLAALSASLFIGALIQRIPGNYTWMVVVPGYVSGLLLFMLVVSTLAYIFIERKMTLWGHHSSTKQLKRYALATSIGQLVTAVAMTAVALVTQLYVSESLLCAGAALVSSICSGAMFLIESQVPYKEIPNETKLPNGEAHEIW